LTELILLVVQFPNITGSFAGNAILL